jgi:hypothetical protein
MITEDLALQDEIDSVLEMCQQSEAPLLHLAQAIIRLKSTGWTLEEVRQIEASVLKQLVGM